MAELKTNKEMMQSEEFENALLEGVQYKKNIVTSYKSQNKTNLDRFSEIMYEANDEVKSILDKKRKNRTSDDEKKLKDFKRFVSTIYKQTQDLCIDEHLEEGQKSKIDKIVERVVPVIQMLRFIGKNQLDEAFRKVGITISLTSSLEQRFPTLNSDEKRAVMTDIFNNAKQIKQKMVDDNQKIVTEVFQTKVPVDLQYDKGTNNTGLKQNDFAKLVDLKTKLVMATSDEAKEKVEDTIEHLAGEKQFEVARAELVRDKLTSL